MSDKTAVDFGTIMASSVHDMKNSLAIILDNAEKLSTDESLNNTQHSALDLLQLEGERLNNIFIQLLALYRIENKQYALNIDSHNVYDCLEETLLENETLLAHHNIEAEIDCDANLEGFFDRALVLGIINTIINNTLRHARNKIVLGAESKGSGLVITVCDDGPGYPDKILQGASEQSAIDFQAGNTGRGLHFAHVVSGLHHQGEQHGHIELSNTGIGGGGRFAIHLP